MIKISHLAINSTESLQHRFTYSYIKFNSKKYSLLIKITTRQFLNIDIHALAKSATAKEIEL